MRCDALWLVDWLKFDVLYDRDSFTHQIIQQYATSQEAWILWCSASVTPTVGTRPYDVGTVMPSRLRNQPAVFQIPTITIVWTANVECTGYIPHTRRKQNYHTYPCRVIIYIYIYIYIYNGHMAHSDDRAVEDVGLRPLDCYDRGFESRRGRRCSSLVCCEGSGIYD
jgi:hypothetical protein